MSDLFKKLKVGDLISHLETGVSVNSTDEKPTNHNLCVLKVSAVTYGKFAPDAAKVITKADIHRAKCHPKKGQIIISRSNTPDLVGASAYVTDNYPNRYLPDKLWQTVPSKKYQFNIKWLYYVLSSPKTRYTLSRLATGSSNSMKNITKEELLNLPVLLPPLEKQNKIVSILDKIESVVEKTEALITAKEKRFEWLVSKTITTSAHIKTYLSKFIDEVSIRNGHHNINRVLSVTNTKGFVLPHDKFERRVASDNLSNYKVVKRGEFAYNPSRINVGSIARLDDWDSGVLSPMYTVFQLDNTKIESDYFLHWLASYEAKQRIKNSAQGSVRESVSFDDLAAIRIPLPSLGIQKDIAKKLNYTQQEIRLLKKILDKYCQQKHGLMQKLLTGDWAVNSGVSHD